MSNSDEQTFGRMDVLMGTGVGMRIEADPLGSVNQIIRLVRYDAERGTIPIKAVLWPIRKGSAITLTHLNGNSWQDGPGWQMLCGYPAPESIKRPQGWAVEVDGREILHASHAEVWASAHTPDSPKVAQRSIWGPLRWCQSRARTLTDALAYRFGYVHEDEAGDW